MRAFLKFLINVALIALVVWLIVRFTTLDDKIVDFFTKGNGSSTPVTQTSCTTPWGVTVPDNASIFAYKSEQPNQTGVCEEEERRCVAWVLQWSYTYGTCGTTSWEPTSGSNTTGNRTMPPTGASCTTPRGQSVAHGNYIVSYESPSSCRFQRRMCVDGQLLGKFMYNYCMVTYQGNAGGWEVSMYDVDGSMWYQQFDDMSNQVNGWGNDDSLAYNNGWSNGNSRQYTPVNYGGNVANKTLPNDYWNQNTKWTVSIVRTSKTPYNPLSTNGTPGTYTKPKDWKNNETYYDLTQKWCSTPRWTFVDHGQYVIAYKAAVVGNGRSCEYERRNCWNGKLNGSFSQASVSFQWKKTYTYNTYQNGNKQYDNYYWVNYHTTPKSSTGRTPRWTTMKEGEYVRWYKYSQAPWSDGCEGEIRYCHGWVLDGSYSNQTCRLREPEYQWCYGRQCGTWNNACTAPRWGTIAHGQSIIAYNRSSSAYGSCESETRTCVNGYLNWSYGHQYCQRDYNNNTSCSLPRWGSIAHGQSVVAYSKRGGVCNSETRYCTNGYLNGSYSLQSCQDDSMKSCSLPRWGSIRHGEHIEAYQSTSSPCYKEVRQCNNGSLAWSFQYSYCNLRDPDPDPSVDTYSSWEDAGWFDSVPDGSDSCHSDATSSFSCQSQDSITCTDYRRVENDCCIAWRAKYERRSITCVR